MKEPIQRAASELEFCAAGVTSAFPVTEFEHLSQWLSKGYFGSMTWMRRDPKGRCEPASLLPGAKSVICVAFEYRFARGQDYHELVHKKLSALWDVIKEQNSKAKFCVDTSPILEKPIAVRAGLGWQGKHSIVIHPDIGSYFVLGEIITDLEIEPEEPMPNRCGNCKKCIEACPTGAIVEPYVLDANRCLSYLTIEHKGQPSHDLTKYIKPGQYGCDICQQVCPFNNSKN